MSARLHHRIRTRRPSRRRPACRCRRSRRAHRRGRRPRRPPCGRAYRRRRRSRAPAGARRHPRAHQRARKDGLGRLRNRHPRGGRRRRDDDRRHAAQQHSGDDERRGLRRQGSRRTRTLPGRRGSLGRCGAGQHQFACRARQAWGPRLQVLHVAIGRRRVRARQRGRLARCGAGAGGPRPAAAGARGVAGAPCRRRAGGRPAQLSNVARDAAAGK